ncbi:MAG: glycosyl hydrolase family 18 protein [Actinomycetes bacterium]
MRRRLLLTVLLAFSSVSAVMPAGGAADPTPRKILTGWIPYYSMKSALPSAVANGDLIKEVMPFWYTLKSESKITDLYSPANPSVPMANPLAAMRDSGFSVIPTITDGTDKLVLAKILSDTKLRATLVSTITNLVVLNNFQGIDLDFEGFAFVDGTATWGVTQPNWVAFIHALSTSLHLQGRTLSVTTPVLFDPVSGKKGYYVYDWASIAQDIDRLRIMTYDYSTSAPGPIGPLSWAEKAVQYAVSVVPASKVYVGLAGYGRDWVTSVVGVCPASVASSITATSKAATFVMRDAATLASSYSATPLYNDTYGEVTFSYQKVYNGLSSSGLATSCTASRTAWYMDARGYAARAQLVGKYHLGGITAWTLGMEDPGAMDAIRTVALSIAPDQVMSSLSSDASELSFGTPFSVKAQFTFADKQPIAGLAVRIEGQNPGDTNWRTLVDSVTGDDGSISAALVVGKTTSLRATSDGTWERTASLSASVTLAVRRLLSISAPASSPVGGAISIAGVVQPHQAGVPVSLQEYLQGKWQASTQGAITDDAGHFQIMTKKLSRGFAKYRVSVSADSALSGSTGSAFTVVIY